MYTYVPLTLAFDFPLTSGYDSKNSLNSQYLKLSMSMTTQSVFKHILTEGDKFLVSQISALEDQGGYALASNYGEFLRPGVRIPG